MTDLSLEVEAQDSPVEPVDADVPAMWQWLEVNGIEPQNTPTYAAIDIDYEARTITLNQFVRVGGELQILGDRVLERLATVPLLVEPPPALRPVIDAIGYVSRLEQWNTEARADERRRLVGQIASAVESYEPEAHPVFCPPSIAYAAAKEKAVQIVRSFAAPGNGIDSTPIPDGEER